MLAGAHGESRRRIVEGLGTYLDIDEVAGTVGVRQQHGTVFRVGRVLHGLYLLGLCSVTLPSQWYVLGIRGVEACRGGYRHGAVAQPDVGNGVGARFVVGQVDDHSREFVVHRHLDVAVAVVGVLLIEQLLISVGLLVGLQGEVCRQRVVRGVGRVAIAPCPERDVLIGIIPTEWYRVYVGIQCQRGEAGVGYTGIGGVHLIGLVVPRGASWGGTLHGYAHPVAVAEFITRSCRHVGQRSTCSRRAYTDSKRNIRRLFIAGHGVLLTLAARGVQRKASQGRYD